MSKNTEKVAEIFNALHELEDAGMPRAQAETTVRIVDRQAAELIQQALDQVNASINSIKKENTVTITVIGVGFVAVMVGLVSIAIAILQ